MRVLLDDRVRTDGVGRYARLLSRGLNDLPGEHRVRLVSEQVRASILLKPFTPWGRLYVGRLARRSSTDLVHGLLLETAAGGVGVVATIHDLIPLQHPDSMSGSIARVVYGQLLRSSFRSAAKIIAPSNATRDALEEEGADADKIVVIPNAVDPLFRPCNDFEREEARRRFGSSGPYVAAIGGAKSHKNEAVLAPAAAILWARTGVPVACRGSRSEGPHLRAFGRLSDEELRLFYGGAELMLLPSVIEGFGFPVVESLACGVPVLCSAEVGVLGHLPGGFEVVDVGDPERIAGALIGLLEDGARRDEMARAGGEAVRTLSVEAMAKRTFSVYQDALARTV